MTKPSELGRIEGAIACDAYCSLDDGVYHAVVLGRDGAITDVAYERSGAPRGREVLGRVPGARDVTAFWSLVSNLRNVITFTESGEILHFTRSGAGLWTRAVQRNVAGARRIAGYDDHHHGIVLTSAGETTDQPFHTVTPEAERMFRQTLEADLARLGKTTTKEAIATMSRPQGEPEKPIVVGTFPAAVDIGALWANDPNRFVILAEASGAITEVGYGMLQDATRRELARIKEPVAVSGCYAGHSEGPQRPEDLRAGKWVVALARAGELHVIRYGTDAPSVETAVMVKGAVDAACFRTPERELHGVLVASDEVLDVPIA